MSPQIQNFLKRTLSRVLQQYCLSGLVSRIRNTSSYTVNAMVGLRWDSRFPTRNAEQNAEVANSCKLRLKQRSVQTLVNDC